MAQAIREIVNFARFDERYVSLAENGRRGTERNKLFEWKLGDVAAYYGLETEEIRSCLKRLVDPASFGLEVRERDGEEYVVRM
jgi:hypothetical protein